MTTVLVTGVDGVVGSEVIRALADDPASTVVGVTRRGPESANRVRWDIGAEPAPERLRRHWDVVVHAAASTRWTMTGPEAVAANVDPTGAVLALARSDTHLVHVSTAYVDGSRVADPADEFEGYRNGYEWSKARCEHLVEERHTGPLTVVRLPLILGRRADGVIARFSGPYTLLQAFVSGLAAVIVGEPDGYAEIAPVDEAARAVADAVSATPTGHRLEVVAGGGQCLRLAELVSTACAVLNDWRGSRGIPPIDEPPMIAADSWHRFYLPLARQELSEVQVQAVELLGMFEAYTSMRAPIAPTRSVADPATVLRRSVAYWAETKPRLAARTPQPWSLVPTLGARG